MFMQPKIAIIGAGPGGLTLANILQKHRITFTVYDVDSSPNAVNQGGTLDLHPQSGQLALREAGLWDDFIKHARPEADVMKIVNPQGEVLWDGNGPDRQAISEAEKYDHRPEIDRTALKEILLAHLDPSCLKWGKKLLEVVPADGQTHKLHFADGSIATGFDLVVGADGAWSKVRRLLTDTMPYYSGITLVELWKMDVDLTNPWMSNYVGAGSCFSFGEGRTVQAQRLGNGSIRSYGCLRRPESFMKNCGIDWTKPEAARKEYVERYYGDCGEDLKRVLLDCSDKLIPRSLYMLPVGFRWTSKAGITLLGDAAHLMTPFAGVGVNAAMTDALELGKAIISSSEAQDEGDLARSVAQYESEMFPRAEMFAQKTLKNLKGHFSTGGSEAFAGRFRAAYGRPPH